MRARPRGEEFKIKPHNWQKTERKIQAGIIKLYACTNCVPAHMKAYDFIPFTKK